MYWITTDALVEKFRTGSFEPDDVEPDFMAQSVLGALAIVGGGVVTGWNIVAALGCVVVTIGGVLHLKRQNGGTFARGYLERYFALGWVTGVRLIVVSVPLAWVLFLILAGTMGEELSHAFSALFILGLTFAWYRYTGILFDESQEPAEDGDSPG